MDKTRVLQALRDAVRADLEAMAQVTADARDEATSGESKAENKYDTRATEASYLAAGQGERLVELRALTDWLEQLDPRVVLQIVGLGALVEVERGGAVTFMLVGRQGGRGVTVDGRQVLLISVDSPLGRVLHGLQPGDAGEMQTPRGMRDIEVRSVR